MGNNFSHKPIITRKLISLIKKYDFYNDKGTKHGKYTRDGDDHKIMVPRHKTITPGTSRQIIKDLFEKHGVKEEDISKLF